MLLQLKGGVGAPILAVSCKPSTWCIRTLLLFATYGILQQNRMSDRLYLPHMALQLLWMPVQLHRSRAELAPSEHRKVQQDEHHESHSPCQLRPSFQNHVADTKQPDKPAPRSKHWLRHWRHFACVAITFAKWRQGSSFEMEWTCQMFRSTAATSRSLKKI